MIDSLLGKKDHAVIRFNYMCYYYISYQDDMYVNYKYYRGDYEAINNDLEVIDWDDVLQDQNVNQLWYCFKNKSLEKTDKHIPKKIGDSKFDNPLL